MTQYQLYSTEDGSPTLITTYESGVIEKMHHFKGALTESFYIYAPAVKWCLDHQIRPHVMSLGLGLGYNELISVGVALQHQLSNAATVHGTGYGEFQNFKMTTFEIDPLLRDEFVMWLTGQSSQWSSAYDAIETGVSTQLGLKEGILKAQLCALYQGQNWKLLGGFPEAQVSDDPYSVVLYDAFSAKMDSPLWNEDFLKSFILNHVAPSGVWATYASTGNLKRSLKLSGFTLSKKEGFGGKKESTFATRLDRGLALDESL